MEQLVVHSDKFTAYYLERLLISSNVSVRTLPRHVSAYDRVFGLVGQVMPITSPRRVIGSVYT